MFKFVISVVFALAITAAFADKKRDQLFGEYGSFPTRADFYSDEYLNGQSHFIETKGACRNLPKNWQNRALSVDTRGTCAKVCDEKDCKGTCKYAFPGSGDQQLSKIDMAKKVASVQGCFQNRS